ncbi:50S ribosomal protein L33 [Candidatus Kaiserbacteria bacterium RIFCSPLOWO2_02_FULL_55_12]|uniref:Large ribosomal subunit protein bL33 n=2 Tax=Candidatus Kaiseribacteriota TaxID=1752734 RepID=A0A1F6EZ81_9BACT|nr:MAG: 50S ribosomal protein L33 [Candidatus Kaiserbacteria bacterium RIFCSPHIGHO2_02_FULL_55_17]OGG78918.1 MAG: 50S ribosomal protein L33 [Candidatus Kaiserbacteria bacterium RIFCSPLOWO2_02_FULL_55_12]
MSQDRLIRIQSSASKHILITRKNKKKVERKIEVTKYDPIARKRAVYKEIKWKGKGG